MKCKNCNGEGKIYGGFFGGFSEDVHNISQVTEEIIECRACGGTGVMPNRRREMGKFGEPEWRAEWGGRLYYGDVLVANIETPKTINYGQLCEKIAAALNALAGIEDVELFIKCTKQITALINEPIKALEIYESYEIKWLAQQLAAMLKERERKEETATNAQ